WRAGPPARACRDARAPRQRRLRRLLRGRPGQPPVGVPPGARPGVHTVGLRIARVDLDGADRDDLSRRSGHNPSADRVGHRRARQPVAATNPRGGGTIYLAVVDAAGNAVSLIESNYMGFGSGVVDPQTGVHYQNRGSYFSLDPDHPNVLAPGKRTLHTLMPGMLFRAGEDRPWVVTGSMGGDAQPQIHAQVVSNLVDGGLDVATTVGAPRWFVDGDE